MFQVIKESQVLLLVLFWQTGGNPQLPIYLLKFTDKIFEGELYFLSDARIIHKSLVLLPNKKTKRIIAS